MSYHFLTCALDIWVDGENLLQSFKTSLKEFATYIFTKVFKQCTGDSSIHIEPSG